MMPRLLYDTGAIKDGKQKRRRRVRCKNFKIHVEYKPSLLKKMTLCELWHNTLFVDRGALIVDFMLDQLDVKRRVSEETRSRIHTQA